MSGQVDWTQEPPDDERHSGQLRLAERVVRRHGQEMRMAHGIGWHLWDGTRWREDDDQAPSRVVFSVLRESLGEAIKMEPIDRDPLIKDIRKCESASGVNGVLSLAGSMKPVSLPASKLDSDPYLFNTPGGTVDLNAGTISPAERLDHITKVTVAPIASEPAPIWTMFLERVLPDPEVRSFVQRLMGVAMLGAVREQYLPIFTGAGANGKGVFRDALLHAFGDYAHEIDPSMLMESKHSQHRTFLMQLRGRRLIFTSETERGKRFAEAQMKRLTGGDPIEANRMHKDPIVFTPSHTLVMITNHLPAVSGDDPAVWRRILVVPFDVVIPPEERDPGLPEKLKAEAGSVLAWAWQGWLEYQRIGLAPPDAVKARTDEYRSESDVLARFLDERCEFGPGCVTRARDLFTEYVRWTRAAGEESGTETAFGKQMAARQHSKVRTQNGFVYRGLMIRNDEEN